MNLFLLPMVRGILYLKIKSINLRKLQLLYLRPNVQYSLELDEDEPFCALAVQFSYIKVSFNSNKWDIADGIDTLPLDSVQVLKDYYQINNVFNKLVEIWTLKLPGYEFITRTLLQQLLIEIYQNKKNNRTNYSTSLKVEKIIEYMRREINNRLTLDDLSDLVQLSPAYLSRVFKETTGYSVIEFFNKIKVDEAKKLIIEGDKKVREVAQILGFTDEFYFSRLFKKIEGINPSEFYRKNVHG